MKTSRLEGKYVVDPQRGCWVWCKSEIDGYGRLSVDGKQWLAHRYSYTQAFGPIPDGFQVHHKCHFTRCVNPDHLELQSEREHPKVTRLRPRDEALALVQLQLGKAIQASGNAKQDYLLSAYNMVEALQLLTFEEQQVYGGFLTLVPTPKSLTYDAEARIKELVEDED